MDALFEIQLTAPLVGTGTAYAEDAEGAYLAYWTLRQDADIQGKKRVVIRNLALGTVVWNAEVN